MSVSFDVAEVESGIGGTRFRARIMHLRSVSSTNQLALEAALSGAQAGVWIADEQTAGRGRGDHRWHSAAGDGLYVSVLATPRIALSHASKIPLATGLAAQAAILEVTGLKPDIRWPNDLMLSDKKCGGILVESSSEAGGAAAADPRLRYAVIGVGINVNHLEFPPELREHATSLRIEGGREFRREPLLSALLRYLDVELDHLELSSGTEAAPDLPGRFAAASSWVRGKRVRVEEGGGYTGWTCGLDVDGFLLVAGDDGVTRTVLSGGVRPA